MMVTLLAMTAYGTITLAQTPYETDYLSSASAFLVLSEENSQFPRFADNALGFDAGLFVQPYPLLGLELQMGAYPYSARYTQIPITAGYRIGAKSVHGYPFAPFASIGAGTSRSQIQATGTEHTAPVWTPCWQVNLGLDRIFGVFSWRVFYATWRDTFESSYNLRSLGLSTGIVYRFNR